MVDSRFISDDAIQNGHPRLREGVLVRPQTARGGTVFLLECPEQQSFVEVGFREYAFLSLLDGQTSFDRALALSARCCPRAALTQAEALALVRWAIDSKLVTLHATARSTAGTVLPGNRIRWHPLWTRMPLGDPRPLIRWIEPAARLLLRPAGILAAVGLILAGLSIAVGRWAELIHDLSALHTPRQWIVMGALWIAVKTMHELAHAIVCRRLGGEAPRFGVVWVMLFPMPYMDVTSAWRFGCKWKRIAVAAAGMAAEILVAAICLVLWNFTTSTEGRHYLVGLAAISTFGTLLFNGNPLMRFDGYYVLSDLLGVPNLYHRGIAAVRESAMRMAFGIRPQFARSGTSGSRLLWAYGIACLVWRCIVLTGIVWSTYWIAGATGMVLIVALLTVGLAAMGTRLVRTLGEVYLRRPAGLLRCAMLVSVACVGVALMWWCVPAPRTGACPCVVAALPQSQIRARTAGWVDRILVQDGQFVRAGQPLLCLSNTTLEFRRAELESRLQEQLCAARIAVSQGDSAAAQVAWQQAAATQTRLDDTLQRLRDLTLVAPMDGQIVADRLEQRLGAWLPAGDLVALIDPLDRKEVLISVDTTQLPVDAPTSGDPIAVAIGPHGRCTARLTQIDASANTTPVTPALLVPYGGALPVRRISADMPRSTSVDAPDNKAAEWELITPQVTMRATAEGPAAGRWRVGQRGAAYLRSEPMMLGPWMYDRLLSWAQRWLQNHPS